jgi:uncharacterized phage-like protein YoqJ
MRKEDFLLDLYNNINKEVSEIKEEVKKNLTQTMKNENDFIILQQKLDSLESKIKEIEKNMNINWILLLKKYIPIFIALGALSLLFTESPLQLIKNAKI